jgi:hypothetical protein
MLVTAWAIASGSPLFFRPKDANAALDGYDNYRIVK